MRKNSSECRWKVSERMLLGAKWVLVRRQSRAMGPHRSNTPVCLALKRAFRWASVCPNHAVV